jgi:translation initiation factor IF-3
MVNSNMSSRKEKNFRKKSAGFNFKEIRLHPNTDIHDFDFKVKHAVNFIEEGNKVKVVVMFKGREMAYTEKGEELLNRFLERMEDIAKPEAPLKLEGRNMSMILVANKQKGKKK